MPVIYTIDAAQRLLFIRCLGNVGLRDLLHHFKALERDPKCPDYLDVFLDLSETESIPDAEEILVIADQVSHGMRRIRFGACAIVARRDAIFGLMRMFEARAERAFRVTCTFRTAQDADQWLAANRSSAFFHPPSRAV